MTATTDRIEVTRYLDQVRTLLVDLPADEREELLDDLSVHLQEVRAETDEPLERILGTPTAFAAELLASSGHASAPAAAGWWPQMPGLAMARGGWSWLQGSAAYRWVRALLPELVPGWWVLRGYLGVVMLSRLSGDSTGAFPVPGLLGSTQVGLVAVIAAVVGSVHLGRRSAGRRPPLWVLALDAVIVLGSLSFVLSAAQPYPEYVYVEGAHAESSGVLVHPDGRSITNLYAYDDQGRLLDGVLLYDQDGMPVVVTADDGSTPYTDGLPVETRYPLDVNGAEVRNAYPLDQRVEQWRSGPDGSEQVVGASVRPPAIAVPRLSPDETASTTTSSTTTTTPGG